MSLENIILRIPIAWSSAASRRFRLPKNTYLVEILKRACNGLQSTTRQMNGPATQSR